MSHKFTLQEIDSAKIQILLTRLADKGERVKFDELYNDAIELLRGSFEHNYQGDPEDIRTEIEDYDE